MSDYFIQFENGRKVKVSKEEFEKISKYVNIYEKHCQNEVQKNLKLRRRSEKLANIYKKQGRPESEVRRIKSSIYRDLKEGRVFFPINRYR